MKRIFFYLPMVLLAMISCQTNYKNKPADIAAAKVALNKTMDNYHAALKAKNLQVVNAHFANDLLFCGTDPKEFWNKANISKIYAAMFADSTQNIDFKVSSREIRIDRDGQCALVLEQMSINSLSPKIPFRMIYHLAKIQDKWQFDFISAGFIPENEDIDKLNTALN